MYKIINIPINANSLGNFSIPCDDEGEKQYFVMVLVDNSALGVVAWLTGSRGSPGFPNVTMSESVLYSL